MRVRPCPACHNGSGHTLGSLNSFEVKRCTRCATLFTASLPSTPEAAEDYSSYYDEGNLEIPAFVEHRLEQLVAGFERYRDRNRWLDVGCGAGALMRAAARHGWTSIGTEVAQGAVDAVRSQGFDVRLGELEDLELEPDSFDVVSAVEVIEHVSDPRRLLEACARLVRPGGVLYMTTPHGRGISSRLLGTGWSVVSPPEHLQLFSIKGLRCVLNGAGLQISSLRTHGVNPRELLAALHRGGGVRAVDRVATGYQLNEALSTRRTGRVVKAAANASLNTLRLGDSIKVTARRPSGAAILP
jgi:SAM-dependent methyltransferase